MDNNIIVKDFGDGFVQLNAKQGYTLFSIRLNRAVSEAVVKEGNIKYFVAYATD